MSAINLPNSCLLSVVLVVSTHSGPQFVFNWPPEVKEDRQDDPISAQLLSDTSDSGWSCSDEDSDCEIAVTEKEYVNGKSSEIGRANSNTSSLLDRLQRARSKTNLSEVNRVSSSKSDSPVYEPIEEIITENVSEIPQPEEEHSRLPWQSVLGFENEFLSELLCPQRTLCNSQFEMTVDDLAFVGHPVHIQPDGNWTRKKKQVPIPSVQSTIQASGSRHTAASSSVQEELSDTKAPIDGGSDGSRDVSNNRDVPISFGIDASIESNLSPIINHELDPLRLSSNELPQTLIAAPVTDTGSSSLRMFHVAFIMNPLSTEYTYRVQQMYRFVILDLVRILRSEQAKFNYVWDEVSKILKIRDKALLEMSNTDDFFSEMLSESSLALALAELYRQISNNQIANVTINDKLRSFQIPLISEFSDLPGLTDIYMPGSVLTTNSLLYAPNGLDGHYAVLLLEEPEAIIRDIKVDPYGSLAGAIRNMSPTLSINSLASATKIEVRDLLDLTETLVYWRRARVIAPIHPRNFYAVSPLATIKDIYTYIPKFRQHFPTLASLPRILSMLSTGKPRPYATLIPSRDHREVYLRALEWLLRHGFVMQLRTFVWLRVPKQVKRAVFNEIQLEEEINLEKLKDPEDTKVKNADISTDNTSKQNAPMNVMTGTSETTTISERFAGRPSITSKSPINTPSGYETSGATSVKNEVLENSNLDPGQDSILHDPGRASGLERRWMARMVDNKPPEWAPLFNKIVKYFNGHESLDKVCALEHISRQEMRRFVSIYEEYLLIVRHW